jgi:hypothetical protein
MSVENPLWGAPRIHGGGLVACWAGEAGRAVGAQNNLRYAVFPETRRLVVNDQGTVYDTGPDRIFGVAQAQSGDRTLSFTNQDGENVVRGRRLATQLPKAVPQRFIAGSNEGLSEPWRESPEHRTVQQRN